MKSGRELRITGWIASLAYPMLHGFSQAYELGGRIRFRRRFASCGSDVRFSYRDSVISFEQISVGDNVFIGGRAYFSGPCRIGNNVMFGPEVQLIAGYHRFDLVGSLIINSGGDERKTIVIEDDVWIGARTTVLKGITVGEGAVVGTGSMVTRDVPPYVVVAGSPATIRKMRFSNEELSRHLDLLGRSKEDARSMIQRRAARCAEAMTKENGYPEDGPQETVD